MRVHFSGPATYATKAQLAFTHTRTYRRKAGGREGGETRGRKSRGRAHLGLLVEEDAPLLVHTLDDAPRRMAAWRTARKSMGCGKEKKAAS
jgi:hypothetical protein